MAKAMTGARAAVRLAAALLAGTAGATAMLAVPAVAQINTASLRGTITAPGGALPTEVVAVEIATGYRRTATVGADGSYSFPNIRVGTYRLEIVTPAGTRRTDELTLTVGQNSILDFDLGAPAGVPAGEATPETPVEAAGDDIIVTAGRVQNVEGGAVGKIISRRLIEQLPQNNRNFLAFAELAPGVQFIEGQGGQSRLQGGAQASSTINVFIDGVSQKDFVLKNGIAGQDSTAGNPFPQLAIGEYQVLSSNYKAEFDQVSSVAITAVTRSGTNEFHGEAFVDFTNEDLRDERPLEAFNNIPKVSTRQIQYGAALGGPIIRDLAHFFGSYEGKRLRNAVDIFPGGGLPPSALPPQYQGFFGSTNNEFNEDLYFGKIDIVPTSRDLFEFTGKFRNESGFQIGDGQAAVQTANNNRVRELRGLARWQHSADTWVNDFRVSYEDISWNPRPQLTAVGQLFEATQRIGTNVNRFGLLRIGGGQNQQDKGQRGWTFQDDFTYTGFEGHTLKAGVKSKWVRLNALEQNFFNPLYTYDVNLFSQTGFNDTVPYRLQFGAPSGPNTSEVLSNNWQFGIYAQDDWDVSSRLTLNIGLRWDYERTPSYLDFVTPQQNIDAVTGAGYPNLRNTDYNINDYISNGSNRRAFTGAFQPRLGFTYRFDDAGRFSMFGGYGRSYDRNQFDFLQQEITVGAFNVRTFQFQGNDSLNPCTPGPTCVPFNPIFLTEAGRQQLINSVPGGGRELRFINNDLKLPYSDQFSLGLRSRFNPVELEVGYSHIESRDGFAWLLGNRRPDGSFFFNDPANPTDTPQSPFGFPPPGFGAIILGTNGLRTSADSAYFKFTKPYAESSPWSLDATYTFTEAEENRQFGEVFSLDFPSIDDYPTLRSSGVSRHRLVMAASADTPLGLTFSTRFTIQSPQFLKQQVASSEPFERRIVGNFAFPLGDIWGRRQLDLAVTKFVPLGFINDQSRIRVRVDIINLMNDRNYIDFNNNPGDNTRTNGFDSIYRERAGFSIGGNQPRTIKLSTGFTF